MYPETLADDIVDNLRQLLEGPRCTMENVPALSETEAAASTGVVARIYTANGKITKRASRKRASKTNCSKSVVKNSAMSEAQHKLSSHNNGEAVAFFVGQT